MRQRSPKKSSPRHRHFYRQMPCPCPPPQRRVLQVLDHGVVPRSTGSTDIYDPAVRGSEPPLKPLVVAQPEGVNFTVNDHAVAWHRWRFRYSLHPREGLVLHQVAWEEAPGRLRPILYRASVAELFVPYADPHETWSWRLYLDEATSASATPPNR